jgi:hypothetical protein
MSQKGFASVFGGFAVLRRLSPAKMATFVAGQDGGVLPAKMAAFCRPRWRRFAGSNASKAGTSEHSFKIRMNVGVHCIGTVFTCSTAAHNSRPAHLSRHVGEMWWAHQDSNLGPTD